MSPTNRSPQAAPPAEPAAVRMAVLPQLRHWIAAPLIAAVLIVAAGLALRFIPALTSADMSVDAELSHDHTAPLLIPEPGTDSFPSGHVALASALAIAVFLLARGTRWQRPAATLGITVAVAVAFSRVYLGVHHPTDVAASFLTAATGAAFLTGLWNRFGLSVLGRVPFLAKFGPVTVRQA